MFTGRRIPAAFAAATLAAALLTSCASTIDGTGHSAAGAAAKNIPDSTFDTLLLSPQDAARIVGATSLTVDGDYTKPVQAQSLTDAMCSGAGWIMLDDVYHGTGYLQAHWQIMPAPKPEYRLTQQGVVLYPTALKANDFVTQSADKWSQCAGKSVTRQFSNGPDVYTLGTPTTDNGTTSVVNLFEGGGGSGCAHSLSAKANVVIETQVCTSADVTPKPSQDLVNAIAARIPS
ncbi:sensor domain-containing protein [Mycolicibacterium sp. Dal123E01]|uniref:sensor domain-containing protein n=1 Tax=Mycolicibacterium sp. Dal123E01 TaxID=3457578 RepID=UPI00403E9270